MKSSQVSLLESTEKFLLKGGGVANETAAVQERRCVWLQYLKKQVRYFHCGQNDEYICNFSFQYLSFFHHNDYTVAVAIFTSGKRILYFLQ
jgi:hypothetical protein